MFTKWRKNRLLNRLRKETYKEAQIIAERWKMRKFVIENKRIQVVFPDIYNGTLNTESKRVYIHNTPLTTVDFFMNELLKISEAAKVVSVEFDQYESGHNVEIEIYLEDNGQKDINSSFFEVQNIPCSLELSERFYFELIRQLERNVF